MFYSIWSLPILSGVADASYRVVIKNTKLHNFVLNAWGFLFTLPYYLVWLVVLGVPSLHPLFWLTVVLVVPLGVWGVILQVKAHRHSPLTLTAPYLSLTPAYSLLTTPLLSFAFPALSRSWPTFLGGVGVLILTFGIYALNLQSNAAGLFAPFKQLKNERGSLYMLAVGFIWSITANLDFVGMQQSNPAFYVLIDHGMISLVSFFLVYWYMRRGLILAKERSGKGFFLVPFIYGTGVAVSMMLHLTAFLWIPGVPYVLAAKRAGTMIFILSLGLTGYFVGRFKDRFADEKKDIGWRIMGTALMFIGMIIIILYGK